MPKSRKPPAGPVLAASVPSTGEAMAGKSGPKPGTAGPRRPGKPASEDLRAKILKLVSELLAHPDAWLDAPNPQFGGRSPGSLLGTEEEYKVYDLINAYDHGLF